MGGQTRSRGDDRVRKLEMQMINSPQTKAPEGTERSEMLRRQIRRVTACGVGGGRLEVRGAAETPDGATDRGHLGTSVEGGGEDGEERGIRFDLCWGKGGGWGGGYSDVTTTKSEDSASLPSSPRGSRGQI